MHINKYRVTTNTNLYEDKNRISLLEIDKLLSKLYLIESPYETKEGIRYYRNTTRLVSESVKITAIDKENNKKIYESMSECAKDLKISSLRTHTFGERAPLSPPLSTERKLRNA